MSPVRPAVIVIHYGVLALTQRCLHALVQHVQAPVFVVNHSSKEDLEHLQHHFDNPLFHWLSPGQNLGFAGGNNFGAEQAIKTGATHLLFLNNDTHISKNIVSHFEAYARYEPYTLLSGVIQDTHGGLWFEGGRFSPLSLRTHHKNPTLDSEFSFLTGCLLWVPVSAWNTLKGFDEDFFLYWEDVDLCLRAQQSGYALKLLPELCITHQVSGSSGGVRAYYQNRNRFLFLKKHPATVSRWFYVLFAMGLSKRLLQAVFKKDLKAFKTHLQAARDGILGKTGPQR